MATKKSKSDNSTAKEIKKDLIPEIPNPIADTVSDSGIVDKALKIAKDSMNDNKQVLDQIEEKPRKNRRRSKKSKDLEFASADESVKYLNSKLPKRGVNKTVIVLVIVIIGGVAYWQRKKIIDKWLDFKAKRILKELEQKSKEQ